MTKKKKIIAGAVAAAAVTAIIAGSVIIWNSSKVDESLGTAYVTAVSDCNTAAFLVSENRFSGVVESQKALEIKVDSDKIIKDVMVSEGDVVEAGDELFSYDVEAMKLELEEGQVEIERMQNEIDSTNRQIKELESEKKNAGADAQVSYTTQIQSLQTDIDKTQYDIKVKNISLEKLKNSIENATVTAEISGTVKAIKTTEEMQENATDVIMTIVNNGDFRIKGRINEQNMGSVMQGDSVIIISRTDDSVSWKGTVSEIENEPEANNNYMYYGDGDTEAMSSNYAFYIDPESTDGLMLGQHVLIEIDYGQSEVADKSGIWLYDDYVVDIDGEKPYVWAADKDGRLEKRYVEIGQRDEMNGDSEIVSGLKDSDLISYPADDYEEGMKTSTDINDIDFEDGGSDMYYDDIPDGGEAGDDAMMFDDDMIYDDGMVYEDDIYAGDGEVFVDDGYADGEIIDEDMIDEDMISEDEKAVSE
ncbi:MAG: efflux RND transporter periplasmic adaptor subunit [Porcipelethomonas sp.]